MDHSSSRRRANPQVQPVIAEFLRTCVLPPIFCLRIERILRKVVDLDSDSENERRSGHVIKLLLTDDRLVIQALLHRKLSILPEIADLDLGDILEIHQSVVRKAPRVNGHGQVVYLGIESCYVIRTEEAQHEGVPSNTGVESSLTKRERSDNHIHIVDDRTNETAGGFVREDPQEAMVKRKRDGSAGKKDQLEKAIVQNTAPIQVYTESKKTGDTIRHWPVQRAVAELTQNSGLLKRKLPWEDSQSDDEQAFETRTVDMNTAKKRRQALHELSQNILSSPVRSLIKDSTTTENPLMQFENVDPKRGGQTDLSLEEKPRPSYIDSRHSQRVQSMLPTDRNVDSLHHAVNCAAPQMMNPSRPRTPISSDTSAYSSGVLHTLSSLYSSSLPSKSYVFTTLVIPTYVASHLITRTNSPFPPKRHIKVIDQSLATKLGISKTNILGKGITVSVYRDAVDFKPTIGKVALMRGVVMQRLKGNLRGANGLSYGEIILNVYPESSRIHRQSQSQFDSLQQGHGQNQVHFASLDNREGQKSGVRHSNAINNPVLVNATSKLNRSETQLRTDMSSIRSRPVGLPTDVTDEGHWFVDEHETLRHQGYDVDSLQSWWNQTMGLE